MSRTRLTAGHVDRVRRWLRRCPYLRERLANGTLSVYGEQDTSGSLRIRFKYNVNVHMTFTLGGETYSMGSTAKMCIIRPDCEVEVAKLEEHDPEGEVVIGDQPIGWELLTKDIYDEFNHDMTFPSIWCAIAYADLTQND